MRTILVVALVGAVAGAGCGDGVSAPQSVYVTIRYSAAVVPTAGFFNVAVTLQNTTSGATTRTFPTGCAIRVRLFRAADDALLYDESRVPCPPGDSTTIAIPGSGAYTLYSGLRTFGDSLPVTTYYVRLYVLTEGKKNPVMVSAGVYSF